MKVLLLHPRLLDSVNKQSATINKNVGFVPPLGLAYIASSLEKNAHQVSILDCEALELKPQEIQERIASFHPDVAGISTLTPNVRGALEAAQLAKQAGAIVVLGGPHLMVFPKETLSYDFVDYGVRGEGEHAMVELLQCLEKGEPVDRVPGIVFRKNGQVLVSDPARVDDIDGLPMPAYHLLPLGKYEVGNFGQNTLSMFSTRGCPYNCGFCYRNPLLDKVRKRDPAKVVDELQHVMQQYKVNHINFVDEIITFDRKHITAICQEIIARKLNIQWQAATRVNTVDDELLKLMHAAGCHTLRFGVESGNPDILKLMNKKITLEQAEKAFKACRNVGIKTVAYFIMGYVAETEATLKDTIAFAKKLEPDYAIFGPAYPLPETQLFHDAAKAGLVDAEYWRDFVLGKRTDSVPYLLPGTADWVARAYRSFYFRPAYIARRLCSADSWANMGKNISAALSLLRLKTSSNTKG